MCSVEGCDSLRRNAQQFKLPEDPERRLEWVQFILEVNGQRLKESSWTDITVCSEHFTNDCFVNLSRAGPVLLKPGAVPSLCVQAETEEPETDEPDVEIPEYEELGNETEVVCEHDRLQTCDSPSSTSEESRQTSLAFQDGPVSSPDENTALIQEKAALLKMKGKFVVSEKRLLQLFSRKCPSCGCKLRMEKVTHGVLIMVNQQCLQCDYRNQWKSQVNADEDKHLTGATEVTSEAAPTDQTSSSVTGLTEDIPVIDEESGPVEETEESSDPTDEGSDEDWTPVKGFVPDTVLEYDEEDDDDVYFGLTPKDGQLCTDCGMFFSKRRSHTCEHKVKPYSCNICGKRCVSEVALTSHSRIHDENYEYRCKYCHVTFKTKVDKVTHEQTHLTQGKPYKCPDCPETFATNKERTVHLEDHRGPKELKCHICGMEFVWPLSLQRHLPVHTGAKPFRCSVCERGFNQASHLKSHMRLHTGERPYKCQHCDKCFNHNVSLKSHVQRYHATSSSHEQKNEKINESQSDTGDAQDNGNDRGSDSGPDSVEEEDEDTEEEEEEESIYRPKKKRRSTGRPRGRPKSFGSGDLVLAVQVEGQDSNTDTGKLQDQKLNRTHFSEEESEEELTDSNASVHSAEKEDEMSKKAIKFPTRSRGRPKCSDSDSDFDPVGRKKMKCHSQNSGKSSGKRRGRPRKNLVV